MADAAVDFLLQNLGQLLRSKYKLISEAKEKVENLEKDLHLFKLFLNETTKKQRKDEKFLELARQIRSVIYRAEDIVDSFVIQQAEESKSTNCLPVTVKKPLNLLTIAEDVSSIIREIEAIFGDKTRIDFTNLPIEDGDGSEDESEAPLVREKEVVGFETEAETLIGYLNEQTEKLDVVSIVGMPGLGKTTLAGKIFHDQAIEREFPTSIWVYVSSELNTKSVFLTILKKLTTDVAQDVYSQTSNELADLVADELKKVGKFLIVLDDVWKVDDWKKLERAFPSESKGKILITSRHQDVAKYASRDSYPPLNLRTLTHEESWLLLCLEVFGTGECPPELVGLGNLIAKQCAGLPLALVVIGGILLEDKHTWEQVSSRVNSYLTDPKGLMNKIISFSYDSLPDYLRPCFLYLGVFPEDFAIPVWKLYSMWIAEGFIQQKTNGTLEDTAESYLMELIGKNLVKIDKMAPDGRVTKCRIHDSLRDFCKTESGVQRENFLQEIDKSTSGDFELSLSELENLRRLSIHNTNISDFLSSEPYGPHIRSFFCFPKNESKLQIENISAILAAFKLLKVLDVRSIELTKIPSNLYRLLHLRYIALFINSPVLPPSFSKLGNLQTIIIDTTYTTLEIKADIWQLIQLRHLKTNASAALPKPGKSSKGGKKLRTLGMISPQSCKEEVFIRTHKLKKLGIRGRLDLFLEKNGSFASLRELDNLETLKLINDPDGDAPLRRLPEHYAFPPKLRSLTLSKTYLDWIHMSTLGRLVNLKVLKLKDKAFHGARWELAADGGFSSLEVLHIGQTNLVVWEAHGLFFQSLRRLVLHNCKELCQIPLGLANISSFLVLNLYKTKLAVASAKKVFEAKQTTCSGFELSIFPPTE